MIGGSGDNHGFTDKATQKRESGNRTGANHAKDRRPRHGLMQSTQFGGFGGSHAIQHRAHRHKQKRFIDDVAKSMGRHAVERQFGPNTNADDHEAQLVIQTVG